MGKAKAGEARVRLDRRGLRRQAAAVGFEWDRHGLVVTVARRMFQEARALGREVTARFVTVDPGMGRSSGLVLVVSPEGATRWERR